LWDDKKLSCSIQPLSPGEIIVTDELIDLKERVGSLDKQLERMENEFRRALGNGEISKARTTLNMLISEAQSTKEFTKALLSKFQLENKDDKVNLCLRLLRYIENIENVILALKEV
jgi:hypothetical protein